VIKDGSWIEDNIIMISQKDRRIKRNEQLGPFTVEVTLSGQRT
jgi:hypothetical protein